MKNNLYFALLALSTVVGATTTNATPAVPIVAIATIANDVSFKHSTTTDAQFAQFRVIRDEALANCKKSANPRLGHPYHYKDTYY